MPDPKLTVRETPFIRFALFLWLLSVATSIFVAFQRARQEAAYRRVALVADGEDLKEVAGTVGTSVRTLLVRLRAFGLTGVAVAPLTLQRWIDVNGISFLREGDRVSLSCPDPRALETLARSLRGQFEFEVASLHRGSLPVLVLPGSVLDLREGPIFLDQELAQECVRSGLRVIARIPNPPFLNLTGLQFWTGQIRASGASGLIFIGEEVLGYSNYLREVADRLQRMSVFIGIVELVSQRGDLELARRLPERVVRVHAISPRELTTITMEEASDRFLRAVLERNIRLCYLRLPTQQKGSPLRLWEEFIGDLRKKLERKRFQIGMPSTDALQPGTTFFPLRAVLWFGLASGVLILLHHFTAIGMGLMAALWAGGALFGVGLSAVLPFWADKLGALAAACVGPVFSLLAGVTVLLGTSRRWRATTLGLVVCVLCAFSWAVLESAFLYDFRFRLKIHQFVGVKLSQLLPVLCLFSLSLAGWWDCLELPKHQRWQIAKKNLTDFLNRGVIWREALLTLLLLAMVLYWMMRTGNEPAVGVSGIERVVREWFEDVLGARPRFKEFAVGYPALLLGFFLMSGTQLESRIGRWMLAIGSIGLASLMNTFSHSHTPIALSLWRSINGLVLGIGLGCVPIGLAHAISRARNHRLWRPHPG